MYGREDDGHSSTSSRYQPADATHAPTAATDRSSRVRSGTAARDQVRQTEARQHQERLQHLGEETDSRPPRPPRPATTGWRSRSHARCTQYAPATSSSTSSASGLLKRNINAATGVSAKTVPGEQCRGGSARAAHGGVEQRDRADALERLRHQHAPRVQPEQPDREVHHPQRGGRLVDGDRVARIAGTEQHRRPVLSRPPARQRSRTRSPSRSPTDSTGRAPPSTAISTPNAIRSRAPNRDPCAVAVGPGGVHGVRARQYGSHPLDSHARRLGVGFDRAVGRL